MRYDLSSDPTDILKCRQLQVVPYAARVAALSDHLGIDLSATLYAFAHLPLCQQPDTHAAVRRAAANLIAERIDSLRSAIPQMVKRHCAVLGTPGRVHLMQDVIAPIVSDTLSILVDMPIDVAEHEQISRIFSQSLGVAKRRKLDNDLRHLTARLREAFPDASESVLGVKLALAILGRDAMMGTFGCSLHDLAKKVEGAAWCSITWPDIPTRTGVPYVERVAFADVTVDGELFASGSIIRAELADYETTADPRRRLGFFGAGPHVCLGRAATLETWGAIAAFLAKSTARPRVVAYAERRDDVFNIPEVLTLEIDPP
jgi:hypothetical protein